MSSEITAWFSDIDAAEAAARQLRHRGKGIRALRIRQPRIKHPGDLSFPSAYAAAYGEGFLAGGSGGFTPAPPAIFGITGDQEENEREKDTACLMVIKSEDRQAAFNVSLLHALHAGQVRLVQNLPR